MKDWDVACMVAVAAVAVAAFCVTLDGYEALYDDVDAVLANPNVRPRTPLRTLLWTDFWGADINGPRSNTQWRPLTTLSYRLDYALFCRRSNSTGAGCGVLTARAPCLRGLHAVNVLLHAAVAALVFRAGTRVLRLRRAAAAAAALVFALHPVHIESVATLYGRADVLCALCMLAACLLAARAAAHARAHRPARSTLAAAAALVAALASALAKEVGVLVAPLVPAVMWLVNNNSSSSDKQKKEEKEKKKEKTAPPVWVVALGVLVPVVFVGARRALVRAWTPPFGVVENPLASVPARSLARVLACAHVHARYLAALVAPTTCSPNYGHASLALVTAPADPRNAASLAAYAAVLGTALAALRRRAWAVLGTVLCGVALFLPASHILFPVGTVYADRLLYLPSVPFVLLAALALQHAAQRLAAAAAAHCPRVPRAATIAVLGVLVAAVAGAEHAALRARLPAWRSARTLWEDVCRQFPRNRVALHNAAVEHIKAGDVAAALARERQLLHAHTADTWPPAHNATVQQDVAGTVALLEFTQSLAAALAAAPAPSIVRFANDVISFFALPHRVRAGGAGAGAGAGAAPAVARLGPHTFELNDVVAQQALWTLLNTGAVADPNSEDLVVDAVVYTAHDGDTAAPLRSLYYQLTNVVIPRRLRRRASVAHLHEVCTSILSLLDGRV